MRLWNIVILMKQVWFLRTYKKESLWTRWLRSNVLKDRNLWAARPPRSCSWAVFKILQTRQLTRSLIGHKIGNREGTSFWYDSGSILGPLIELLRPQERTPLVPRDSAVKWIINGGRWQLLSTYHPVLGQLQNTLPQLPLPIPEKEDRIIWLPSPNGIFNAAKTWEYLHSPSPYVAWQCLVWFPSCTPKHSFILWLACWRRLPTMERPFIQKDRNDRRCLLCGEQQETLDHLFCECSFTRIVWQKISRKSGLVIEEDGWDELIRKMAECCGGKTFEERVQKWCFAATVYTIWRERNSKLFDGLLRIPNAISHSIFAFMYCKLSSLANLPIVTTILSRWRN